VTRKRSNNDLCTPAPIIDRVVKWLGPIDLDPCSNEWSLVGAAHTYSIDRGEDGLSLPWFGRVWENPPYGRGHLKRWAMCAARHSETGMAEIISIVPTSTETESFAIRKSYADVRIDLSTRVKYGGGKHGSGMFGSTIFYSGQRPYLFAHAFADCGEIIIYNRPKRPL